jgi:hypothetical protein
LLQCKAIEGKLKEGVIADFHLMEENIFDI